MKKTRILLVEDEAEVLRINKAYLEDQGYEVLCAETLREARASLWEYPPDLIVLDVLLPDGSGYDLCREIRKISSAPVIFLTCNGEEQSIVEGLGIGGNDYMVKPYSLNVLHARIAAQLRRRGASGGEIILPPLHIDLTANVVRLNGEVTALPRMEYRLLVYLAENRGQELSQPQIYEAVWGGPPERMGNTVRVHVSRLRRRLRLDETGAFELSPTANQGYMFLRTLYT